jgi:repressor LexA
VQAGALSTAVEDLEGYVSTDKIDKIDKIGGGQDKDQELFALRVRGESMTGAGIFPNDLVIVRRQSKASSGEIVVALVEDEATVKRLRIRTRGRGRGRGRGREREREREEIVELHPENPAFDVIRIRPQDPFRLLGKVIEIRRYLN